MIDADSFFDEISANIALWCEGGHDSGELARAASATLAHAMPVVSALPDDVSMLWTWLEKSPSRIYARFYLPPRGGRDVNVISDLTGRINAAFKHGAHGAQIFMRTADLTDFAAEMGVVRDDLFFNRDLAIGIDISEVEPFDWGGVFEALRRLRAGALVLVLGRDAGDKSDFVGRVYALLSAATDIKFDLHFVLGNRPARMEQVARLVRAMRPGLAGGMRMFVRGGGEQ